MRRGPPARRVRAHGSSVGRGDPLPCQTALVEGERRWAGCVPSKCVLATVLATVLAAVLAGCGEQVAGAPRGAAGFGPPDTAAPAPPQGQPRRLDGVDVCALLTPADLAPLGGAEGQPRRDVLLPESCAFPLAGAPQDVVAVAFYKPLEQARTQRPEGALVETDGLATWLACQADQGYQTCAAAVAVRPDRTLLTMLSRRDVSVDAVRDRLETITRVVLARLPVA